MRLALRTSYIFESGGHKICVFALFISIPCRYLCHKENLLSSEGRGEMIFRYRIRRMGVDFYDDPNIRHSIGRTTTQQAPTV
jgi:hypothetical protein